VRERRLVAEPSESERRRGERLTFVGNYLYLLGSVSLAITLFSLWQGLYRLTPWLIPGGILLLVVSLFLGRILKAAGRQLLETRLASTVDGMDPYEFEAFVADLYREMGYYTKNVRDSADQGVDVIAKRYAETLAVQVKHYSPDRRVGSREVRDAYAGARLYDADRAVVVTNSYFSKEAVGAATRLGVELIDCRALKRMIEEHGWQSGGL